MIEVYAIADRDAGLPAGSGLQRVTHGDVAGVYANSGERPKGVSAESLWRHERLVEALMVESAVLPLRYGTVLPDERELEKVLADRSEEFTHLLDTVRGRVEVALRVLDGEAEPIEASDVSTGRAYMEALARRRRRGEHTAGLLEPLKRIADATHKRESAADHLPGWAFLIDRGRLDEFNAQLAELRDSHPDLRMTCTGPWPPYSFVTGPR